MFACLGEATLQQFVREGEKNGKTRMFSQEQEDPVGACCCLAHKKADPMGCHHKLEPGEEWI